MGYLLRVLRVKSGHSQEKMANLLGISRSNYSQIEMGNQYPTFDCLCLLARIYNKTYEWILHGLGMPVLIETEQVKKNDFKKMEACIANNKEEILFIDEDSAVHYVSKCRQTSYLQTLSHISVPFSYIKKGFIYRAFTEQRVAHSNDVYLKQDVFIGKCISSYFEILRNELYILITVNEILFLRVDKADKSSNLLLCSNEWTGKQLAIPMTAIQEIWEVVGRYSGNMRSTIENLETAVHSMEHLIGRLEGEVAELHLAVKGKSSFEN